ncbi:MAG: TolC family protein, partial [Sphingomonas fennica]
MAALAARTEAARGLAEQAHARPNPSISGYVENIAGSDPYGGLGRAETTIQYNHVLELGGKRSARIAAGEAGVGAALARAQAGRVAYAHDLARAYAMAEIAGRRIAIAEDEVAEAIDDLKVARALVAAGKEARLRELRADSEVAALGADLAVTRAAYQAALGQLSVLAGVATPFTGLSASLIDRLPPVAAAGPIDLMVPP